MFKFGSLTFTMAAADMGADDQSGGGGTIQEFGLLLVPPVAVLSILGLIYGLYLAFSDPAQRQKSLSQQTRRKSTRNEFVPGRTSLLESDGSLFQPWSVQTASRMSQTSLRGWLNLLILMGIVQIAMEFLINFQNHGSILSTTQKMFFEYIVYGILDLVVPIGVLYLLFCTGFVLEKLASHELISDRFEKFWQYLIEIGIYIGSVVYSQTDRTAAVWPFSHKAAVLMQAAVMVMKMHSYVSANRLLRQRKRARLTSTETDENEKTGSSSGTASGGTRRRRRKSAVRTPRSGNKNSTTSSENVDDAATSIDQESKTLGPHLHGELRVRKTFAAKDKHMFIDKTEPFDNDEEDPVDMYPNNTTFYDFWLFSFMPTLVYESKYPRTERTRIMYIAEKVLIAMFVVTIAVIVVSNHVHPVLAYINTLDPISAIARLMLPFTTFWILVFFLIFECITNAFAEFTRLGDRRFYDDWWNCTTFTEFSRKWNRPVHEWLFRHVYLECQHEGWSAGASIVLTFFISIIAHEVLLIGMFHLISPWLLLFSLLQFPLMLLMRINIFKGKTLGNVVFWIGLIVGIPLVTVLYALTVAFWWVLLIACCSAFIQSLLSKGEIK